MILRCLIVDDEPLAREGLAILLERDARIDIVAECGSVEQAVALCHSQQPDVVFLDIEMPGTTGLEFSQQLSISHRPLIVFVTAHASFAVAGFEQAAVDYLLKPVDSQRLAETLDRVQHALQQRLALGRQTQLLQYLEQHAVVNREDVKSILGSQPARQTLALREGQHTALVALDDIIMVEAAGDYMCISTRQGIKVYRITLQRLLRRLDASQFIRIHRSLAINCRHLHSIESLGNGIYQLQLSNGASVRSSKAYRQAVTHLCSNQ
ncbi:MAG: LytTR family DNA-binding domain-containing protein [Wenzhouxiangellaceae bacterium]